MEEKCELQTESKKSGNKKILYGYEVSQMIIFVVLLSTIIVLPLLRIISDRVGFNTSMIMQQIYMVGVFGVSILIIFIESLNNRVDWKTYKIPYGCLIVMWLFSFVLSFDAPIPKIALFGNTIRGEGLLQIGAYYGIFFLASVMNKKAFRNIIIYAFCLVASVFSVLGIFQFLEINMFKTYFYGMASFGFGNPNYVAAYMVMFSGISMAGYWLYEEGDKLLHPFSWWNKWIWLLLLLISYIGCITTRCSSVYVGLIMNYLLLIFLSFFSRRKKVWRVICIIVLLIITMFIFNVLSNGGVWGEFTDTFKDIEAEGTIFGDSVGTSRMKIWKQVIQLLPSYWLYGCGIEHYGYVSLIVYGLTESLQITDVAHNEYLHTWITRGIIPLILYLVFLFYLFIPGVMQYKSCKSKTYGLSYMMLFPFFGYIAQAFFSMSMINVAPYFWMFCGFFLLEKGRKSYEEEIYDGKNELINSNEIPEKNIEKI